MKWMTTMMMMIRVKMVKLAATNAAHHSNSLIYSFHLLNQGGSHPPWLNLVWWLIGWRQTTYKLNNDHDDDFIPVLLLIAINEQRIFVSFWPSTWSEHKRCQPGYHQCCSRFLTWVDPFKPLIFFLHGQLLFQFSLWFWQTISSVLWWVWW